ncbi:helix-turn-helix domain-containing protein [Paenibacillus sp. JTLBN-2024]
MPASCDFKGGICVGSISAKTGLAQSVISGYLVKLQKAGLLESRRAGQWTYYRRNEEESAALSNNSRKSFRLKSFRFHGLP